MLQLQLALNLPNLMPFQPKHPAPVHILRVLATVQKLQRLPAADTGGGPLRVFSHGGTQSARKPLSLPGKTQLVEGVAIGTGGQTAARISHAREGGGGHPKQATRNLCAQSKDGGRVGPPQTAACAPITRYASKEGGEAPKPGGL